MNDATLLHAMAEAVRERLRTLPDREIIELALGQTSASAPPVKEADQQRSRNTTSRPAGAPKSRAPRGRPGKISAKEKARPTAKLREEVASKQKPRAKASRESLADDIEYERLNPGTLTGARGKRARKGVAEGASRPTQAPLSARHEAIVAALKKSPMKSGAIARELGTSLENTCHYLNRLEKQGVAKRPAKMGGEWSLA